MHHMKQKVTINVYSMLLVANHSIVNRRTYNIIYALYVF